MRTLTIAFNSIVRSVFNLRRFDHVSQLTWFTNGLSWSMVHILR